ncbi:UDP-4-amino-4,6-dideoxy-N-acetyl-beta-L-altrosamine N-acetyltransferase [Lederbergia ruris]|uniref:N-acetyltransferase domain-containing protein n=1 Tax=Lederbergia ruris TaxID=217495 RepID=A0ABQ4KR27_9BACI|nr:UDP-4-amino-4,6-dideoxy-N-acetyl-beta-L-altrosamine N-acetyltransferase [Lederbergia ruris]GIN59604.1 hypothetical protein J8TS2_39230 [Lederbergia ruris]
MSLLNRSSLRELTSSHLDLILSWRNQPFIRSVMYQDEEITFEQHRNWFAGIQENHTKQVKVFYFDDQPMGVVQISVDEQNKRAEWGFYIGEPQAPRGIGKIMGYLAIEYIFHQLSVQKLCAEVLSINAKSIQYHKKLGFQVEGILKEHILKDNRSIDVILLSLFRKDWNERRVEILKQIEGRII